MIKATELCEKLNIVKVTLYRWIKRYPDFPAYRAGGLWMFEYDEVLQWIKTNACHNERTAGDGYCVQDNKDHTDAAGE